MLFRSADEALTFANHPLSVLAPERAPRLIMSLEDRIEAIRAYGVGKVTVLPFTRELANVAPADFAAVYLTGKRVSCGANWRFGKGGKGEKCKTYSGSGSPSRSRVCAAYPRPGITSPCAFLSWFRQMVIFPSEGI